MAFLRAITVLLLAVVFKALLTGSVAYEFSPDWTIEMPLPYSREIAQAFLHAHNVRRAAPPRSAANMRKLVWNTSLIDAANRLVSKCSLEHNSLNGTIGQTLYAGGPAELNADKANETLIEWYDRDLARHPMDEEGMMEYGTALQILWAQIRNSNNMVGVLTACNYYPPGNYKDRAVFKIGEPCIACSEDFYYCDNTMCPREHETFVSHFDAIDPSIKVTLSPFQKASA